MRTCPRCHRTYEAEVLFCSLDGERLLELDEPDRPAEGGGKRLEDPLLGKILDGRYLLKKRIGKGGMGKVYRAEHLLTGREVAVKVLHLHLVDDATIIARFRREARTPARIDDPGVVEVLDAGEQEDVGVFYVMELIPGQSLVAEMKAAGGAFDASVLREVFGQILRTLERAHAVQVVHRDLKPDNVLLVHRPDGPPRAKILDFGIAGLLTMDGEEATRLTQTGAVVGTPAFMSPEQAMGHRVDQASDIYSMGVMLYWAASGKVPYSGATPLAVLQQHLQAAIPSLREPAPGLAPALDPIITRAMAKEPHDRFASAELMRLAIEQALPAPQPATLLAREQPAQQAVATGIEQAALAPMMQSSVHLGAPAPLATGTQSSLQPATPRPSPAMPPPAMPPPPPAPWMQSSVLPAALTPEPAPAVAALYGSGGLEPGTRERSMLRPSRHRPALLITAGCLGLFAIGLVTWFVLSALPGAAKDQAATATSSDPAGEQGDARPPAAVTPLASPDAASAAPAAGSAAPGEPPPVTQGEPDAAPPALLPGSEQLLAGKQPPPPSPRAPEPAAQPAAARPLLAAASSPPRPQPRARSAGSATASKTPGEALAPLPPETRRPPAPAAAPAPPVAERPTLPPARSTPVKPAILHVAVWPTALLEIFQGSQRLFQGMTPFNSQLPPGTYRLVMTSTTSGRKSEQTLTLAEGATANVRTY